MTAPHTSYPKANPFDEFPEYYAFAWETYIHAVKEWRKAWEKKMVDELIRLDEIREESLRIQDEAFKSNELYPFWNFVSTVIWSDIQKRVDYNDEEVEMKPEKLYRCPICGDVVTNQELERGMESGGMGMCYCEYSAIDPGTGDVWYPRVFHEYDVYRLSPTTTRKEE